MKIWIDVLTPKQANLFSILARRLREHGHEPVVTTRRYREVEQILQIRGTEATVIGRHGGAELAEKLLESSKRVTGLAEHIATRAPSLAISFCSPEAARVAFGLGIPHYALCDSPHASAVCRLSIPLSQRLFTPKAVPKAAWKEYGIASSQIVRYNALDPAVWIPEYSPGIDPHQTLGLDEDAPFVVLRVEEEYASYLIQRGKPRKSIIPQLVRPLRQLGIQVVLMPRYESQVEALNREYADVATVTTNVLDGVGLVSHALFFIGAGGTMNAEAALIGTPTISCYPSTPTYVDRYLLRPRLVERVLSPRRVVSRVRRILSNPRSADSHREKAREALSRMEDPLKVITSSLGL